MKLSIEIFSSLLLTGSSHVKLKILEVYAGEDLPFLYGLQAHWQFIYFSSKKVLHKLCVRDF